MPHNSPNRRAGQLPFGRRSRARRMTATDRRAQSRPQPLTQSSHLNGSPPLSMVRSVITVDFESCSRDCRCLRQGARHVQGESLGDHRLRLTGEGQTLGVDPTCGQRRGRADYPPRQAGGGARVMGVPRLCRGILPRTWPATTGLSFLDRSAVGSSGRGMETDTRGSCRWPLRPAAPAPLKLQDSP